MCVCVCVYVYIYKYMYIKRDFTRVWVVAWESLGCNLDVVLQLGNSPGSRFSFVGVEHEPC